MQVRGSPDIGGDNVMRCPRCDGKRITVFDNGMIRCDDCKDYVKVI